MANLTL